MIMKATFRVLFLLILLTAVRTSAGFASASPAISCPNDTTRVLTRLPLNSSIEKFNSDPEFQYKKDIAPQTDWWGKFWQWVYRLFDRLFSGLNYGNFWQYVFILIIAGTATFVILKLLGINLTALFSRRSADIDLPYETLHEDVRIMDFDKLIADAIDNRNFRLAVRLYYLKTLKELNNRSMITWKPEKTNHNYITELSALHLKEGFQQMTHQFEFVWYGEFDLAENEFNAIRQSFLSFQQQII
ncbi:hypothetical protein D3C72_403100 [compost metagenome]